MQAIVERLARRFGPDLASLDAVRRHLASIEIGAAVFAVPLALAGLVWLLVRTDWRALTDHAGLLALMLVIGAVLSQMQFRVSFGAGGVQLVSFDESLAPTYLTAGLFMVGPGALWLLVAVVAIDEVLIWWRQRGARHPLWRWSRIREVAQLLGGYLLGGLAGLALYEPLAGYPVAGFPPEMHVYPMGGFAPQTLWPGLAAVVMMVIIWRSIYLPNLFAMSSTPVFSVPGKTRLGKLLRFYLVFFAVPLLMLPFSLLLAGIYGRAGETPFLFLSLAVLLVGVMLGQFSRSVERAQQRSSELTQLQQLSRALLAGPPDAANLPDLLREFVPPMFISSAVTICRFPDEILVVSPEQFELTAAAWRWMADLDGPRRFRTGEAIPWSTTGTHFSQQALAMPLLMETETGSEAVGAIFLMRFLNEPIADSLPAVQSLAGEITTAWQRAAAYQQRLIFEKTERELTLAGEIQSSFLPTSVAQIFGPQGPPPPNAGAHWRLALDLRSARQASGDFYDAFRLSDTNLGFVVADVADKGIAAALYMALSRTLIRTYAMQYPDDPALALTTANRRIMMDTTSDQFVTVFYGVLDMESGLLTYCNAGHNPPYLLGLQREDVTALARTGIPLGMFEDQTWQAGTVQLALGDLLIVYSDGVTEAQNAAGALFETARLLDVARAQLGQHAEVVHAAIQAALEAFVGAAPQADDITLLTITWQREDSDDSTGDVL